MTIYLLITIMGIGVTVIIKAVSSLLTRKIRPDVRLKKYIMLIKNSLIGFFIFGIMHNIVSGLLSLLLNTQFEERVFLFMAIIICPIGLIVGIIGTIIRLILNKTSNYPPHRVPREEKFNYSKLKPQ